VREYETTLLIQPEISDEAVGEFCARLDGIVEKNDGIRLMYDDQGRRRLAYEIQNFQKGRHVMLHFLDDGSVIPTLERALRLEDSILRFLTVLVNDDVQDIEARKAEAAEDVRIREQRAAERAAREAEEAVARAAREAEEAVARAKREAEEAAARVEFEAKNAAAAAADDAGGDDATSVDDDAASADGDDAVSADDASAGDGDASEDPSDEDRAEKEA
jgi:small subunit ribosomal protein S6